MSENSSKERWEAVNSKTDSPDDIFSMWEEQKRLQKEDIRLEKELVEAKRKARELKKTLYINKFGEQKSKTKEVVGKSTKAAKKHLKHAYVYVNKYRKQFAVACAVLLIGFGLFTFIIRDKPQTEILGDSVESGLMAQEDLPREKPAFSLLFPDGKTSSNYDIVRISPPEADASYTFLDRFSDDSQIFRVTQQEIPKNFNLEEAATGFQATSIIDVDGNKIYHGYSEGGGIQSILFIKKDKLILIRSTQRYSDDQWAAYYLSLK